MAAVTGSSPLKARRELGAELRLLRDQADMTTEEVGARLNCHNSKVSRIETGKRACTKKDFDALMELFGVDTAKHAELDELAKRARQRVPPWWHAYNDVISANYAEFLAYEAEAVRCREVQTVILPAQVQTPAYSRAVTGVGFAALGPDQVDSLVEVKTRRQERLREEDPMIFECVVTEAALRLRVGGTDVMRAQLRHLREVAQLPNVTFRVIPFEAGENAAILGAFTLFATGKETDADVAFMESADGSSFRDDPLTLRRLNRLISNLFTAALSAEDSLQLVERIEKEMV